MDTPKTHTKTKIKTLLHFYYINNTTVIECQQSVKVFASTIPFVYK